MERGSRGNRITSIGEGFNLTIGRHQEEGLIGCVPFAMLSLPGTIEMTLKIVYLSFFLFFFIYIVVVFVLH